MPRLAKKAARTALRLPSVTGQGCHMGLLDGRVALVSGGGRGIGRAISERLAAEGAAVAVNYRRDAEAAADTVATIEAAGGVAKAYAASVDDAEADAAMVDAVLDDFGFVDLLVANAGVASRGNAVADTDPAEVERLLATHAVSAHHLARLVLPSMRERPRGDIVMISSVATSTMAANGAPYNMAKAALEALADDAGQGGGAPTASTSTSSRRASSRPTWASAWPGRSPATGRWRTSGRSTPEPRSGGCASPPTSPPPCCGCAARPPATSPASASRSTAGARRSAEPAGVEGRPAVA